MTQQESQLNTFLVEVFNDILRLEEQSLRSSCKNLSVSELHVLEAVDKCSAQGPPCMAEIAAALNITAGTLTISIKTLEQKGYVERKRSSKDKRRVSVALTPTARPVLDAHSVFHANLVKRVAAYLSPDQIDTLCTTLAALHHYFTVELFNGSTNQKGV